MLEMKEFSSVLKNVNKPEGFLRSARASTNSRYMKIYFSVFLLPKKLQFLKNIYLQKMC